MSEDKYQPCPCGSGKKFKFCCYEKRASVGEMSDRELIRRAAEFRIHRCLITADWQEKGLAEVFVVRQLPNLTYLIGLYLVDVFCLGVKNTFVRTRLKHEEVRSFLNRTPEEIEEISYEDARSVVIGAVEYALGLGLEPHEDWAASGGVIESERPFERKFKFGQDGKPFYIQGPHDNVEKIMRCLAPLVKAGLADYMIVTDPKGATDDMDGVVDSETSFEEWCDEVSGMLEDKLFEDARDEIEYMMEEFPERSEPFFLMGTCLAMEGKADEAIRLLSQAISIEPSPEAYCNLGAAYKSLFRIEEWVDCLKKVIELDGKKGEFGKTAKEDLDAFSSAIQKSDGLTLDGYFENLRRFERAFKHLKAGQFEEAVRGFVEVLKVEPRHVQSHGNLGLAYAGLGDRDRAIAHLDKAIALDPDYQPAVDNRRFIVERLAGERLTPDAIREVEFYGDRARASSRQTRAAANK